MKVMKLFFISMMFITSVYAASRTELLNLQEDALVFGRGPTQVYAFIDPLCSKSQDYISLISTHEKLLEKNTYYIFLHRLEKFQSDSMIDAIYSADDPKEALLDIMLSNKKFSIEEVVNEVKDKRTRIDSVADSTGMLRRPYVLIYPAGSNICKVSEGTAPCMLDW